MTSGRSENWLKPLKSVDPLYTVNGCPVWMLRMPEVCHPPKICRVKPLLEPKSRCPGPMGKLMLYTATKRWRVSNDEGPRSRLICLASSMPPASPLDPKNADALSIDLLNV